MNVYTHTYVPLFLSLSICMYNISHFTFMFYILYALHIYAHMHILPQLNIYIPLCAKKEQHFVLKILVIIFCM